jgi:ribonuclease D
VANKWLEALKAIEGQHNTSTTLREAGDGVLDATGEIGETLENGTDKTDKNTPQPKKPRKKKLTPEEEEEHRAQLAKNFPAYVYTADRAREVLEWIKEVSDVSMDIETHGRLKRDGLLYTKCDVRMILLHHDQISWFIDCDHVPGEMVVEILEEIKDKPKYLHNSLFDVPRLYRRFGVLLDQNIHDTLIASRVAHAGEWERKKGRAVQKSHSLDDCLKRELGVEIPKDTRLKWGGPLGEEHLVYAGDDISHLRDLHYALQDVLEDNGVKERYDAVSTRLPDFI